MPAASHAPSRAHLSLSHVTVTRGAHRVLSDLSMTVTTASRIGVVGENGRGKSTLLHLFTGELSPDEGTVSRHGSLAIAEQAMPDDDGRTVGDAVAFALAEAHAALAELDAAAAGLESASAGAGAADRYGAALDHAIRLDAWDADRRVQVALEALDAPSDRSRTLATLSVGQRYRVRLACLLAGTEDFLLLDEPTNHLDASGLQFLTARLRERRGGVVLVSHDRTLLRDVAESILDLDPRMDGRPALHGDGYDGYVAARAAHLARWEQAYAAETDERARLSDALSSAQSRLVDGWRPDKGTGKHARATRAGGHVTQVRRRQADLDAHAIVVPEPPQRLALPALPRHRGTVLEATALAHEDRLVGTHSLTLRGGDRLLLVGPNGAGKSTLLGMLAGTLSPTAGHVHAAPDARIVLLDQDGDLAHRRTASDLYRAETEGVADAPGLASLGLLSAAERGRRVGELSQGKRRRLALALALARRPHALLLDEPTNHLSVALVDDLTEALHATPAAVIVATHDRQLLRDLERWPVFSLAG